MNRSRWKHIMMESGLCIDSPRLLDWILGRPWAQVAAFRFLRLRFSPNILNNALALKTEVQEKSRLFSLSMSYINVGDTYKTTGSNRTQIADMAVSDLCRHTNTPRILEVGASDGSSAAALLENNKLFSDFILTDRFSCFFKHDFFLGTIFYNSNKCLLGFKLLFFYLNLSLETPSNCDDLPTIETVNPLIATKHNIKSINHFNILTDKFAPKVDLIKCANVLNLSYFSEDQIRQALNNFKASLTPNGYLVISQNNDKYADGEAIIVLKNTDQGFEVEHEINGHDLLHFFKTANSK